MFTDRTVFEHLLCRYRMAVVCRRERASGYGYGISPLGGGHHNPIIELPELTQDWEIYPWRAQQNLVHQDPGQRNSDPTGDCPGLACGCPGISGKGVGQGWPAAGLGAQTVAVHAWDLFREVNIIFITSTIVWAQVNSRDQCCKEQYCIGTWNVRSMNQGKFEVIKQEMERLNINILGISELKWAGMGEFNSDDHYIYYCGQESLRRNRVATIVNKRV